MPTDKNDVINYADHKFLVWLEDHITYFQNLINDMNGILSVYSEMKNENQFICRPDIWMPSRELIAETNAAKSALDQMFNELLAHQHLLIISEQVSEHYRLVVKQQEETQIKNGEESPEIV